MVFVLGEGDLRDIVLLRKPNNHKNPLFRDKWTVPGGLIENGETALEGAARELLEEAALQVPRDDFVPILTFSCNCDPTEAAHEVVVFGVVAPPEQLLQAKGTMGEPVATLRELPNNLLWYIEPLLSLVKARLKQPR
jgi:ADP-ribose pyrophosphatase YjhB (NUDIX family)